MINGAASTPRRRKALFFIDGASAWASEGRLGRGEPGQNDQLSTPVVQAPLGGLGGEI